MQAVAFAHLLGATAISCLTAILLVVSQAWHGKLSLDPVVGRQKFHLHPTPRIGGIPVFLALLLAYPLLQAAVQQMLLVILLAGLPAFSFGLAEDLSKRVGVLSRLLATMASGVLAWWLSGQGLSRLDIIGLDWALQWWPVSVLLTAVAVGGVANAVNISDGLNGLASSACIWAFLGLGGVAQAVGDADLAGLCWLLAAATFGFFLVNWPLGKIFLGDGGAYFLGFALAWISVLLTVRNPGVSAFAALLVCVHPITEVLFSIYRRKLRQLSPGMPDQLHFHSLVKRRLMPTLFPQRSKIWRNSAAGLLVGTMTLPATMLAQLVYDSTPWAIASVLALMLGYVSLYARLVRGSWCSPLTFLLRKPVLKPPRIAS